MNINTELSDIALCGAQSLKVRMATRSAREIRGQAADNDVDDLDLAATECEMVLSKEEFDMLQTFHRFVPLPALTSRILRVYCEDDLQVPEAPNDDTEDGDDGNKPSKTEQKQQMPLKHNSSQGNILRHPCRPNNFKKKPHIQINLTSQTARIQQNPPSRSSSTDSERPESQE